MSVVGCHTQVTYHVSKSTTVPWRMCQSGLGLVEGNLHSRQSIIWQPIVRNNVMACSGTVRGHMSGGGFDKNPLGRASCPSHARDICHGRGCASLCLCADSGKY